MEETTHAIAQAPALARRARTQKYSHYPLNEPRMGPGSEESLLQSTPKVG